MTKHKLMPSCLAASVLAFALGAVSPALAQTKLVIGQVSRTATNWPHFVAESQGLFKAENLTIQTEYVGNVATIAQQVVGGSLDIGNTTFEIVVQAVESGAPIMLIGSTVIKYPYTMLSAKDVKSAADVKGKKVMLPVPKNDIANFFESWLQANGVKSADVDKIYDGSSTNRYAALTTGAVSAAAVTSPLDFMGETAGFNKLIDFASFVKAYGFVGIIARKDWLARNRPATEAYLRAVSKATDWLYDPANKEAAIVLLMRETKQDRVISEKTYKYLIEDLKAFSPKLTIPDADFNNVLKAFQDMGVVKAKDAAKDKYVDLSFLK
jgi:ABC-type nitrate/sulfonate/bicarbonate transport system substrate-binding protein